MHLPPSNPGKPWRGTLAALCLSLAACWFNAPVRAEVIFDESSDTFDIGVRSGDAKAVWNGISRWGPSANGGHALGTTTGKIGWSYQRRQTERGCSIHGIKVTVSNKILLPGWPYKTRADSDTLSFWNCVERTVSVHEQRHAEIWRETGEQIDQALQGLSGPMRCESVESTVNAIANRIHGEGNKRQQDFDYEEYQNPRYQKCLTAAAPASPKTRVEKKARSGREADSETKADGPATSQSAEAQSEAVDEDDARGGASDSAGPRGSKLEQEVLAVPPAPSLPYGLILGGLAVVALLVTTHVLIAAGRRSSPPPGLTIGDDARAGTTVDRRVTPHRRQASRTEDANAGRRAADFGRRPS